MDYNRRLAYRKRLIVETRKKRKENKENKRIKEISASISCVSPSPGFFYLDLSSSILGRRRFIVFVANEPVNPIVGKRGILEGYQVVVLIKKIDRTCRIFFSFSLSVSLFDLKDCFLIIHKVVLIYMLLIVYLANSNPPLSHRSLPLSFGRSVGRRYIVPNNIIIKNISFCILLFFFLMSFIFFFANYYTNY